MTDAAGDERSFKGLGVSGGIVLGYAHVLGEQAGTRARGFSSVEEETRVFRAALGAAAAQIEALIAGEDKLAGDILEFQLALLEDDDLLEPVFGRIAGGMACDAAWAAVMDGEIAEYRRGGDDTLAERAADLADLKARVLRALGGAGAEGGPIRERSILIAADLTPSAFLSLDWTRLAGVATLGGSPTSHVAILARARGVNLMVGLNAPLDAFTDGTLLLLDAEQGILTLQPDQDAMAKAMGRMAEAAKEGKSAHTLLRRAALTADGQRVYVLANIDEPDLLGTLWPNICDGVGLARTEFLFQRGLPGEEEQFAFYYRLIAWAGGRPVTIRTLDAGGDKPVPGLTIDGEANPFLGVRGVRLSLARPEIFRIQLRALLRAATLGPLKVMVPMVTVPAELETVRAMMQAELADLERAGEKCVMPPLGMMVEVPAAALTAANFAADFYSIGSNDLIQYTMAAARDNASLSPLADPLNPAVLELIRRTVEAAHARGVEVSLCGDMASTPAYIGALLDAGLTALSCAPAQIGPVKLAISRYRPQSGVAPR